MKILTCLVALAALAFAPVAMAQVPGPAPAYKNSSNQTIQADGVVILRKDTVSGLWCFAGSNEVSCPLTGAGGGGGSNASVSTTATTAPTSATMTGGKDAAGNLQATRTDAYGGEIAGQMTGTATRTTLTASASTALPGAATTTRPSYLRVTIETALTSNLYLCLSAQTCSATVYDELIPSGAAAGTRFLYEFPFLSSVTYFTTTTPTVNATRLAN